MRVAQVPFLIAREKPGAEPGVNVNSVANPGALNTPNYGQPSGRTGQMFGTVGPRAFQFAERLVF